MYSVAVGGECWPICTGTACTGVLVLVGIIPSMVQEGIMIVICIRGGRRGCHGGCVSGCLRKKEIIVSLLGLSCEGLDRTSSSASALVRMAFIYHCAAWRVIVLPS